MLGINGLEGLVLLVLAALLFGDRLPEYSQTLARWVRELRIKSEEAKQRLKEEVPEIQDVDWRKMDPRQYDPRKIIKDALMEDLNPEDFNPMASTASGAGSHAAGSEPSIDPDAGHSASHFIPLTAGVPAPFDLEAT